MKLSVQYRQRLAEYLYFVRLMRSPGHSGFIVLNSKMPIFDIVHPDLYPSDPTGKSANEAMCLYESRGKTVPCREGTKLAWLMAGKGARDWHITQWGEALADGIIGGTRELAMWRIPSTLIESARQAGFAIIRRRSRI